MLAIHSQKTQRERSLAFETFQIVAIGDIHGSKDVGDFVLSLVRNRAFPSVVNDIVVEGANGLLQPILDQYMAGDDVPIAEATTALARWEQSCCWR
jgi:hypothetical protein